MKFFITMKDEICGEITTQTSSVENMLRIWKDHGDDVMLIQKLDESDTEPKIVFERCW